MAPTSHESRCVARTCANVQPEYYLSLIGLLAPGFAASAHNAGGARWRDLLSKRGASKATCRSSQDQPFGVLIREIDCVSCVVGIFGWGRRVHRSTGCLPLRRSKALYVECPARDLVSGRFAARALGVPKVT